MTYLSVKFSSLPQLNVITSFTTKILYLWTNYPKNLEIIPFNLEDISGTQWHLQVHDLTSNRKWKYSCMLEIKMHHKTKVDQQHRFFLRIFFPTHFDHWKPKYGSWHYCILWILGMCLHEKSWSTFFWCRTHLLNISF